nr:uncharacterized protein LOC109185905 isoform X2 [Ipomoea trifida]
MSEKDEIKKNSEELMSEKDEIKKNSEELMSEKDEIKKDSEELISEKDEMEKAWEEELMAEKDQMEKDWEELMAEAEKEKIKNSEKLKPKKEKIKKTPEELMALKEKARAEKEKARVLRKQRELNKAVKGLQTYITDEKYRLLHDKISDLFAEMLEADVEKLNSGKLGEISLAAKWCPTIDSSYDKTTLICESIARKLFPRDKYTEYEGLKEAHYVYKVRDRLRKQVLVPLHKALELPEVYMSAKQWNVLPYKRVASVAMKNYTKKFAKHDNERFNEYLRKVKTGEAKIAAGALLPHEIIKSLERADTEEEAEVAEVAELQWKRMVDDLANKGKLSNCIAICDVSGSMIGIPMDVSVALGILISELSEEPWKGNLITFSADPQLHKIKGETLLEKTAFVKTMDWGMNTNFQKAFDRILEIAVEGKLSQEQMIRRVFVFSDMEFDEVRRVFDFNDMEFNEFSENSGEVSENSGEVSENSGEVSENPLEVSENPLEVSENPGEVSENSWETDYEAIQRKFREKGFTNVPEVVFWNLRASKSTPVVANQSGVALVSGFSKNLLTIFLENGGIVNPEEVMELAISGEEYKKLAVLD